MNRLVIDSPLGAMTLEGTDTALCALRFGAHGEGEPNALLRRASQELSEYFAGKRREFDLPLSPEGTDFQKKVWRTLCDIPFGETRSYKDIAEAVGNPKGLRAVGMANNRNPIAIIIPCHRVIGKNGSLTGYGGGLDKKAYLLKLEKR